MVEGKNVNSSNYLSEGFRYRSLLFTLNVAYFDLIPVNVFEKLKIH